MISCVKYRFCRFSCGLRPRLDVCRACRRRPRADASQCSDGLVPPGQLRGGGAGGNGRAAGGVRKAAVQLSVVSNTNATAFPGALPTTAN